MDAAVQIPPPKSAAADAHAADKRHLYMDALRLLACFLVIVNHTNSLVFQSAETTNLTWYVSIAWYYISKIAVAIFVMVGGACLLPKQDTPKRAAGRIGRLAAALVVFSYFYYVIRIAETGEWDRALNIPAFLLSIWEKPVTDAFWYLYFYLGMMVMMPLFQRLAQSLQKGHLLYLMALTIGGGAAWPLLVHYVPDAQLPQYFDICIPAVFVGLLFTGHYLHAYVRPKRWHIWVCAAVFLLSVALSVGLTHAEYYRVASGEKYWFMDERTTPSMTIIVCAVAMMHGMRCVFETGTAAAQPEPCKKFGKWFCRWLPELGACAFGVYLLQDRLIAMTRYRLFVPLAMNIQPFIAGLVWEAVVFAAALPAAMLLRRIPGLRKLL